MINARFMYLRPGNLFKDFVVESNTQVVTASGRVVNDPKGDGSKIIRGCLAESTKEQKESHSTRDRVCTHTIVQAGSPEAKKSDKLILGNRTFYIIDLDEVGSLGISTMGFWPKNEVIQYAVEQRIPICSVYGTPYQDKKGNWYFTGEQRTGCCVCGFGCHLEPVPNRLQRLRTSDNDKHRRMCEGCLQIKNHGMTYEQALNYAGIPTEEVQEDE